MVEPPTLSKLLATLREAPIADRQRMRRLLAMARLEPADWQQVLAAVETRLLSHPTKDPTAANSRFAPADTWLTETVLAELPPLPRADAAWNALIEQVGEMYRRLRDVGGGRFLLLEWLAASGTSTALEQFVAHFCTDPPRDPVEAARACVPLFQRPPQAAQQVFPALFDAMQFASAAPAVLDLANYWTARGVMAEHPARQRSQQVLDTLHATRKRLVAWEASHVDDPILRAQARADVKTAEALWGPLCHAVARCGAPEAADLLRKALAIDHRRLRVEAAAALAHLRDATGVDALVALAAEPVVRRRALAALAEAQQLARAKAADQTPAALAEAELAEWLAAPAQFGLAPHSIQHLDCRRQYWPGYEQPVECHLLRYEYRLPAGTLAGVGIVGPLCFSLSVDLQRLSLDDVYALYAGWHAEHPEMVEVEPGNLSAEQQQAWDAVRSKLLAQGYQEVELAKFGLFFETPVFVAAAQRTQRRGVVVVDPRGAEWLGADDATAGLSPHEAYCLYKGRQLMHSFNERGASNEP